MIKYLALELRRSFRDRRYLLLVAGWPVAAYLLFSTVFGSAADRTDGLAPTVEIMVAMASFGAMGGVLLASGPRLAMDRQMGWLRQLRLTPLSPARILAARLISAMALSLPAIVLTFIAAVLVKGVTPPALGVAGAGARDRRWVPAVRRPRDPRRHDRRWRRRPGADDGPLPRPRRARRPVDAGADPASALQTVAKTLPSYHLAELGWRVAQGVAPAFGDALVLLAGSPALRCSPSQRRAGSRCAPRERGIAS